MKELDEKSVQSLKIEFCDVDLSGDDEEERYVAPSSFDVKVNASAVCF